MKFSFDFDKNFYEFIKKFRESDPRSLYLQTAGKTFSFPVWFAVEQIECRRKTSRKLPVFLKEAEFLFPSTLSAEQATHQCVASYHSMLAGDAKRIADLTAGLGIDAFTLARGGAEVTAIELDTRRAKALRHNSSLHGMPDIRVIEGDCMEWLKTAGSAKFDLLFVDPARRDSNNERVYFLSDCLPNIVDEFESMLDVAERIMVKASPIIDITSAVRQLPGITDIHIVCVEGECKEVLLIASRHAVDNVGICVVDLAQTDDASVKIKSEWSCKSRDIQRVAPVAETDDLQPGYFIYDPNAGMHKLNCAGNLCRSFNGLMKLSNNTDLYVSPEAHYNFPGRIFRIDALPSKKDIKKLKGKKMEVAVRNYPMAAAELLRKLGLKQGGDDFIFGASVGRHEKPMLIACHKVR